MKSRLRFILEFVLLTVCVICLRHYAGDDWMDDLCIQVKWLIKMLQ